MKYKEEIITLFELYKSGTRGWFLSKKPCLWCGKEHHLGIVFGEKTSSFRCNKCQKQGHISVLLREIGRTDLLDVKTLELSKKLESRLNKIEELKIDYTTPIKSPPMGYRSLTSDPYLESRGFTQEQFKIFSIGETKFHLKLKQDYIVFLIINNGEVKGYLGRSRKSKKEIALINEKRAKDNKYLRWVNSPDTDFKKLLFGLDEIVVGETTTVILVEGLTSKGNIDRVLNLYSSDLMKCCATFGKTLSVEQIKMLLDKGIENIILLYDPDAINESKKYSLELTKELVNIEVGYIPFKNEEGEDKDPGDLSELEVLEVLNNLESPFTYSLSKVQKKKLL